MQNETLEIIEMVQNKHITAEEGAKLIDALKEKNETPTSKAKWLKIMVQERGQEKPTVNIKLPIGLTKLISKFIPSSKREDLKNKGIDLDGFFSGGLLNELKADGTPLIDINDPSGDVVKISVE
ncbi:MAG TPA: hypothetical protein VJB34_04635 [Bdellovibrionota bacterium]|nr:hypothetical protein [Bdellovibrionota bacterium]